MFYKALKLTFFAIIFLWLPTQAQQKNSGQLALSQYNAWLKAMHLNKFVIAADIKFTPAADTCVLTLTPANNTDLQKLAGMWVNIQDGLKKKDINIHQLMLNKLALYAGLPLTQVKIVTKSAEPDVFLINISFDTRLNDLSVLNMAMGGEVLLDYDFDNPYLNTIIRHVFVFKKEVNSLRPYCNALKQHFSTYHHRADVSVQVTTPVLNDQVIIFNIWNVAGHITTGYNERIILTVVLNDPNTLSYIGDVQFAGGGANPPKDTRLWEDATKDSSLEDKLKDYNKQLKDIFKQVLNAGR